MELREWTAAAVDPGEGPPEPEEWVPVEDPGSPARFADERAVAYRTKFTDPREGGERALLRLRGLYAHARVWLNGERVGSHDTYFTPFRTVFDPADENELVVECRAPTDRFGGVFQTPLVWPEASVPGIRWGASVEPVPANVITDLTVRPDTGDETGINAIVTIDARTDLNGRIRLSLSPEGTDGASALSQVGVSADAGERVTVQGRLSVRDPDRWWPRGFGPQNRYTVRAALGKSERTTKTGFRTVEYGERGLFVNGTQIPVRGVVSLPADGPQTVAETVERAVAANATLIRWYGHAPPTALADAADAAGVLVQQDVPLAPGALDVERARLVARTLAGEYGHHPSLAVFGVHDDAYGFDATAEEGARRVVRATGQGDRAVTATAAVAALPDDVPAIPVTGLGAGHDGAVSKSWILDGYAGTDCAFDAGAHTRYVVPETAEQAARATETLRRSGRPFVTAFSPPSAASVTESIGAAFEPVGVFLDDPETAEPRVVVVNDTPESVASELEWSAGGESGTLPAEVGPVSREAIGEISVPLDAPRVELSLPVAERTVTNRYER
jgi:hypothetical protein